MTFTASQRQSRLAWRRVLQEALKLDIKKSWPLVKGDSNNKYLIGATLKGLVDAQKFQIYSGLNHISAGLRGALVTHHEDKVQFSFFAQSMVDQYQSSLRGGEHHLFGVSVSNKKNWIQIQLVN